MISDRLRALVQSPTGRGLMAGALGGLVLTSIFLQTHGASLNRYALDRGKPAVGYLVVWLLALIVGSLFGRFAGLMAERDLGYALGRGLLVGLGWFVAASCLVLPVLRGVHPFSFNPSVGGEVVEYLVYGMLLGVGYYQIGELLQRGNAPPEAVTALGTSSPQASTSSATTPVRVRRNSAGTQPMRRTSPDTATGPSRSAR
jgi:hypothetical protein